MTQKNLNVRQTEAMVKRLLKPNDKPAPENTNAARETRQLEQKISETIGQPVAIRHTSKGSGKLIISYNSLDELDGILEHITD